MGYIGAKGENPERGHIAAPPKTAIIGAGGFLGRHFLSSYRRIHPDCIATVRQGRERGFVTLDLADPDAARLCLSEKGHKDALILAGITRIDACEKDKEFSWRVNVAGTLNLIRQLVKEGIKPVFFSSDYVFDGRSGNYADSAPLSPITEYGRQKARVEAEIAGLTGGNYLVVRLSKTFSIEKGSATLLDEMASTLKSGGMLRAAYDQIFCPTLVTDVIRAVGLLQAKKATGVVNVCAPEAWSRYDLAAALAGKMGIVNGSRVVRISLDDVETLRGRPKNTSMATERLFNETGMKFTPVTDCIAEVAKNWENRSRL